MGLEGGGQGGRGRQCHDSYGLILWQRVRNLTQHAKATFSFPTVSVLSGTVNPVHQVPSPLPRPFVSPGTREFFNINKRFQRGQLSFLHSRQLRYR